MTYSRFTLLILASFSVVLGTSANRSFADAQFKTEGESRALDYNAYLAKKKAVGYFQGVVEKSRGTSQESLYLLRYSQMAQETAAIQYRLAYGQTKQGTPADLTEYRALMNLSLESLNRLIAVYPQSKEISQAYRLRAHGYAETEQVDRAIGDLKYFVEHWPKSPDNAIVNIDLWTLLIQTKNYLEAIHYITRYGLDPNDKNYPTALEKMAWCKYFLGAIEEAIVYTESQLKCANKKDRDKALSNLPLFYSTGIEKKYAGISATAAAPRFQRSLSGEELGKALVNLGFMLRAKGLDADLETFRSSVESVPMPDAPRAELILLVFENELNRRDYEKLKASSEQIITLYKNSASLKSDKKRVDKIRTTFMSATPPIQKSFLEQDPTAGMVLGATLKTLYEFALATGQESVLEKAKLYFNIGEIAYRLGNTDDAIARNRWVVDHLNPSHPDEKALYVTASHRSIDVQYELIKKNGWVSQEIAAAALSTPHRDLPKQVKEWIDWVDHFPESLVVAENMDASLFESNRVLYFFGHVDESIKRLNELIKKYPNSKFASASASLVVDTYIASRNWGETFAVAAGFLKNMTGQTPEFHARLTDVVGDSYCKILDELYQKRNYPAALKGADDFMAKNPGNKRQGDILIIAANSSLGMGDKIKASGYLKQLNQLGNQSREVVNLSFMTEGSIAEENFDFASAASNYLKYIDNGGVSSTELRSKTLLFAWLSSQPSLLKSALASKPVCSAPGDEKTAEECDRYSRREKKDDALDKLKNPKYSAVYTKISLLKKIPEQWEQESALGRYALLADLSTTVPEAMHALRSLIKSNFRVKLDAQAIGDRLHWIESEEKAAQGFSKIPSSKLRLASLVEVAGLYEDLVSEFNSLRLPKGLSAQERTEYQHSIADAVQPFQKKVAQLRQSALDFAATTGSDEATLAAMVGEFKLDHAPKPQKDAWGSELTALIQAGPSPSNQKLVAEFKSAIEKSNWPKAGFLIQLASAAPVSNQIPTKTLAIMKAILLVHTQAMAEAVAVLKASSAAFVGNDLGKLNAAADSILYTTVTVESSARTPAAMSASPVPSPSLVAAPSPSPIPLGRGNP